MAIAANTRLGQGVVIHQPDLVNLYGCAIGDGTRIGAFVEIQRGAVIGARCKISSHTFICEGVTIEDEVFVGHGVMFINDPHPRATADNGALQTEADWTCLPTRRARMKPIPLLRRQACTSSPARRVKRPWSWYRTAKAGRCAATTD